MIMTSLRIGHGYDVHRLVEGRKLILGGVEIPHTTGLLGHSDADVLIHAVMDAIIGALGEGDIGRHFPDSDNSFLGISSRLLAEKVCEIMKNRGARVVNIDCTVIAQKPKLSPYISLMRENIAKAFDCDVTLVNVKATTEEGLGFSGAEEGISAHAVCLISFES
jgi:2-C-methyl-D-erythritol 2,4-cyclodiphosphate synthase